MIIENSSSATLAGGAATENHVVIFPFMAMGHTIPLIHFAASLVSRGLQVTLLTTPANAGVIRPRIHPDVRIHILPFPRSPLLPVGCESTDRLPSMQLYPTFLRATTELRSSFASFLLSLPSRPLCVISDFFFGWTLSVCRRATVPRLVFHGMSSFSMFFCKALWTHREHDSAAAAAGEAFYVSGSPEPKLKLTFSDVPFEVRSAGDLNDPVTQFVMEVGEDDINSWGVLVNSPVAIDCGYAKALESFYRGGARAWLVGPMCLLPGATDGSAAAVDDDDDGCFRWLDSKPAKSVLYVAFGTQVHVSDEQLDELARGLDAAGCYYLCVIRNRSAMMATAGSAAEDRGKIVEWAPQIAVLQHPAVGGFMSHCGWNSCLEAIAAGVPVLAWPMIAEQPLNAKLLVDMLGVGLRLGAERLIGADEIEEGVRELMEGEKGNTARKKMAELSAAAKTEVEDGGASACGLEQLLKELRMAGGATAGSEDTAAPVESLQLEVKDGIVNG